MNDGKLVTSVDKYRSYLLVINKASRYSWIFLTRTKQLLVKQVNGLLQKWKGRFTHCTVTTDQDKELGASVAFKQMLMKNGYVLKTTVTYSSAQNRKAEKPNQDLARIIRCLLYSAGLGS